MEIIKYGVKPTQLLLLKIQSKHVFFNNINSNQVLVRSLTSTKR